MARGRAWGIIVSFALAGMAACDTDDGSDDADGGGVGGEQAQAGTPSVETGGSPNQTGGVGEHAGAAANPSTHAGEGVGGAASGGIGGLAGSDVGGQAGGGSESLGGSNGQATGPRSPTCPDSANGGYGGWYDPGYPVAVDVAGAGGAAGAAGHADAEFHRVTLGTNQIAIAINDSGKMLIRSGVSEADSCQAWVVDAESVNEVTTGTSGCVLAVDMNEAGTVLASQDSVPFLWKDGVATALEAVASGAPVALNDAEQVLLSASPVGPALWEAGTLAPLRTPTDEALQPVAMNATAQIIGYSGYESSAETWLWQNGAASPLGLNAVHALNDVGDVAGTKNETAGIWSGGTYRPLLSDNLRIHAITNDGILVGDAYEIGEPDLAQPFRFEAGVVRSLALWGSARDINRHGEIVGRRNSIRFGPQLCDCWTLEQTWSTLWVQDCPVACCGP